MSAYGFLSLRGAVPSGLSQTIHSSFRGRSGFT